jgi:hypothetical protein
MQNEIKPNSDLWVDCGWVSETKGVWEIDYSVSRQEKKTPF